MSYYITLHDVRKKFGKIEVLKGLSLNVKKGEIIGLFGPSGSGKSTILNLIAGLERPDGGRITLRNTTVASDNVFVSPEERNVSMVFQDLGLWPHMTVEEHLKFVSDDRRLISVVLKQLGLEKKKDRLPEELSGGERQRVSIARALTKPSDILLLDEPFSFLDLKLRERVKKTIKDYKKKNESTVVIVSHSVFDFIDLCDRVAILKDGKISKIEKPRELLLEFQKFYYRKPKR
ncbi:MAG: ATP-binding cassette domain-containing protein [Candidatus Aenigmarchaeota archaeon]|nr:ATP-binding cassette domain-containing protein [Candidatus Aenigmarchaeota archaeon]